jgi:O-ureido-D-serine cyclo-ligase
MVQPYLACVDEEGETAIVFFGGSESHVLRKRAVLRPDEEAPVRREGIAAAEVMFDEDLVGGGEATQEERATAAGILDWVAARFEAPLYARVDLVPGADGRPVLLELEAVEPHFYLHTSQGAAARLAEAVLDDLRALG